MMAGEARADLIIRNAKITTLQPGLADAEAPAVRGETFLAAGPTGTSGRRRGGGNRLVFVVHAHSGASYRTLVSRGDWLPGTPARTCPQHSYEGWNRA